MGYTTDFEGEFLLDRPLEPLHEAYLKQFSETRRMKRDAKLADDLDDPIRIAAGLPIGFDGAYFVGGRGHSGQDKDNSILEYNHEPPEQPGLWCQWVPTDDSEGICWDGTEKFYEYTRWLEYIIEHFLEPWHYTLNGEVYWQGEVASDMGKLIVKDNKVIAREGKVVYD